ncbi:Leucine-rich repeat and guanylate kinase domain-containing protein, partial [Clarias magur]
SRPASANATNYAFRQSVHPQHTSMRSAQSGDSPKEPTGLISEKFQCTEYEAVYGPK